MARRSRVPHNIHPSLIHFFSPSKLLVPLLLQLPLSLLVVLRRIDTVLVMIHKVEPRQHPHEQAAVPALPRRHALHVRRQLRLSVERLPALDLVDHLAHVHLDFAAVLGGAVEAHCSSSAPCPYFPINPPSIDVSSKGRASEARRVKHTG